MPRPSIVRTRVSTGVQQLTKTYDDGHVVVRYLVRVRRDRTMTRVGTFTTQRTAETAYRRALTQLESGDYVAKKARQTPFLDVAQHWLTHHPGTWQPRTLATNTDIVDHRLASLHRKPISAVTYEVVTRVLSGWTNDGLAFATRKRSYAVLKAVLADAQRRDLISRNPCDKVKWKDEAPPPEVTLKIPSVEDVERLINQMSDPWSLLVELAAYSGLRAGELAGLQVRHIDTAARSVRVEQTVVDLNGVLSIGKPKSKAGYRTVTDLDPDLCRLLAVHLAGKRSSDFAFGGRDDEGKARPHSHRNFAARFFQPAVKALGLSMRFHDLRHFNASLLFDEGLSPLEVAHRLGHHDGAFTLRTYGHLFAKEDEGLGQRVAARRSEARTTSGERHLRSVV